MRFIFQVLAVAIVAAEVAAELKDGVRLGEIFGGPHGDQYSDLKLAEPGQKVNSITIRASDRVDAVALNVTSPSHEQNIFYHGGNGGDENTLTFAPGEYITYMYVRWGKHYRRTRIFYIEFTTNLGNEISGGKPNLKNKLAQVRATEGYQLGGFQGFAGDELDSVGAIWTSVEPLA